MVKLTADLILQSAQYINAVKERELDLRGYKAAVIENLGVTLDQFDTIDLSDNEIRKLDGFPLLKRLHCLLLNNNRICRISDNLEESLPNLESLILTNNHIQELGDLDPLSTIKHLTSLSLLKNPVSHKKHYRLYVIFKVPQLRTLDFRKIRKKERDEASVLFKGKKGKQLEKDIVKKTKTFVPGDPVPDERQAVNGKGPEINVQAIKEAITKAKTLEEVDRLTQLLKAGQLPARDFVRSGPSNDYEEEMETEASNNVDKS